MEDILLINLDDILHYTQISGVLDVYKLNPHILNSQILYLEPILGSTLYDKMLNLVSTGDINLSGYTNYSTLLNHYITPSVCFHTIELAIPLNSFIIADGGSFQASFPTGAAQPITLDIIDKLTNKYRIIGQKYDDKLAMYLNKHKDIYPEYVYNSNGLIKRTENTNRIGVYLGDNHSKSKIRI